MLAEPAGFEYDFYQAPKMTLSQRSTTSLLWNALSSQVTALVLFTRSVLLARLLPVEVFGIYTLAGAIVYLSILLPAFGLDDAFLHRSPESEVEEPAAAVHFTLKLVFLLAWALILIGLAAFFARGSLRSAIIYLTIAIGGFELTHTTRLVFTRRVAHRRLAVFQTLNAIFTTLLAVGMALGGADLWALLITDYVTLLLAWLVFIFWKPVWKPRLALDRHTVRYFLAYGSRVLFSNLLQSALDKLDDLWTGAFLGNTQLGFYSRAYTFATYPRRLLANPVDEVARGTYAEISHDRQQLGAAFRRSGLLLVRSGFFLGGWLSLAAPELILLLLGEKWLPMLAAFRLMLVYTLLDPLKGSLAYLFIATGQPETVIRCRLVQLAVLVTGLFSFGRLWGIAGVALAVDLMLLAGIGLLFWQAARLITFSLKDLFLVPAIGLALALLAGAGLPRLLLSGEQVWQNLLLKSLAFGLVFLLVLVLFEPQNLRRLWTELANQMPGRWAKGGDTTPYNPPPGGEL